MGQLSTNGTIPTYKSYSARCCKVMLYLTLRLGTAAMLDLNALPKVSSVLGEASGSGAYSLV